MRILLDSHIPAAVARELLRHGIDALTLRMWMGGVHAESPDEEILSHAYSDRRVLVTYDLRTIPTLLMEWAEIGRHHAGVVLIDEKTVQSDNVGGILRALLPVVTESGDESWEDKAVFLHK